MSTPKVRVPPFQFEHRCPQDRLRRPKNTPCKMRNYGLRLPEPISTRVLGAQSGDCGVARTRYPITFVPSGPNPRVACMAIISGVYLPFSNATTNGSSSVAVPVKLSEAQ